MKIRIPTSDTIDNSLVNELTIIKLTTDNIDEIEKFYQSIVGYCYHNKIGFALVSFCQGYKTYLKYYDSNWKLPIDDIFKLLIEINDRDCLLMLVNLYKKEDRFKKYLLLL